MHLQQQQLYCTNQAKELFNVFFSFYKTMVEWRAFALSLMHSMFKIFYIDLYLSLINHHKYFSTPNIANIFNTFHDIMHAYVLDEFRSIMYFIDIEMVEMVG